MSPVLIAWRVAVTQACHQKGYQVTLSNDLEVRVLFRSKPTSKLCGVCRVRDLWETCVLEWRNKPFKFEQLVRSTLAFLVYYDNCVHALVAERDGDRIHAKHEAALFAQIKMARASVDGFTDKVLNDRKAGLSFGRQVELAEQAATELMQQPEDEAKRPSKWAKKKAKQKERARQLEQAEGEQAARRWRVAAQWATLARKARFATVRVPAKQTQLELAKAAAEEWVRRDQRKRWVRLAVGMRCAAQSKVAACEGRGPTMEMRHAAAAAAARAQIDRERGTHEKLGKSMTARMAVKRFDALLETLPAEERNDAHNNREGPWNKARKAVWKAHSERDEAEAAEAKEAQRKVAEEAERARAERAQAMRELHGNARAAEKAKKEQLAQALRLSTKEAHASEARRAQVERLEALAKAHQRQHQPRAASPPPPPPPPEEEADDECLICWNAKATHITVPCGHQVYCANCVPRDLGNCPMCRAPTTHVIKFFKRGA